MAEDNKPVTFNPAVPIVHSVNGFALEKAGFVRNGTTYTKDNIVIKYDGVSWKQDGREIQFMEEIKKAP